MQQQSKQTQKGLRNRRISNIRDSLKKIPIISKNTTKVQEKIKNFSEERCSPTQRKIINSGKNQNITSMEQIHQLSLFEDKYEMGETIGEGANGFVNKCTKIKSGKLYAVKSSMMDDEHVMGLKENFLSIHALNHPNIIQYHALYIDMRKKLCSIVMEYVNLPSLQKVKLQSQQELKEIIYQLLDSVRFLHQKNISHRDLKPQNILYDVHNKKIKIIDFGTSRQFIRRSNKLDMLTITGTLFYRAPEMFTGGGYDQKVDIWAIGVLIYKLVCGKTPFESIYLSDTINNIKDKSLKFEEEEWKKYDPSLKNLIKRMLKKDKNLRLSATDCLKDIWFYSLALNRLVGWTQSYQQLPNGLSNELFSKSMFHKSKQNVENAETQSLTAITEVKHKIDGEDCFVFDSEQQDMPLSQGQISIKNKIKKKRSGSMNI